MSATYDGRGDGGRGSGRLYVTGREGDRVQGVFAADVNGSGLLPGEWRVMGAFDAALGFDGRRGLWRDRRGFQRRRRARWQVEARR